MNIKKPLWKPRAAFITAATVATSLASTAIFAQEAGPASPPATEAEERSRRAIPLWCWGLAIVVVLGAGWLLSRY